MEKTDKATTVRLNLGPRTSKILGGYALVAMHGWFLVKFALPSASGGLELAVGLAAITGMIATFVFFISAYGVLANAPDDALDERELADRNRAYVAAFKYLVAMTIVGGAVPEIFAKAFSIELSVGVMQNFLLLMLTTALVLPAYLLALGDKADA